MNRLGKACAVFFVVVCFAAPPAGLALPRKPPKPPKPTPTPVPEPDPEIVYVCGKRRGKVRDTSIMVMNADGSNQTEVVDCGTMSCSWPDWSPDGSQIIFVSNAFDTFNPPYTEGIYVFDLVEGDLTKIIDLKGGRGQPAWSPVPIGDEHWIVYSDQAVGTPDGYHDLFAYGVDTQRIVPLTSFPDITVYEPAWSADCAFLSARHMWDLHPWHVYNFIFSVEENTAGEGTVPALGPWLDTDQWNYNNWYYWDTDPTENDNCGFGSTDWSNGQYSYPYMMLGGTTEVTFRLDFDNGYPYVVYPDPDEIGVIPLEYAPVDLREQVPPDMLPIWVTHGRFSPDNSQFVFRGVIRDPNLKATGIYVASTFNAGEVDELVKMRWPSSVESPEWRP